ncbi:sensor histidine kinase KdpD [Microbacterium sp.]|uniref:sensor histidine kinase n=1 Tax=Microbacterium sp. TaxID=51671 RepID=UPI000927ECE0|nr:HAMP domain-containing sensor histidine kinase [Microbacterium sp.]MBN9193968.1 HAMP domain-containing histidine kinase [Microbacterium sp.]OJU57101.1 MAG: two-component sensor histidine kinase [Microbacterium sp. 70-38]
MIPLPDLVAIVGIALACAIVVGAAGLVLLHAARRSPMLVRLCIVVLTASVSMASGMVAVAQAMFLSGHDLLVGIWIAGTATVVSLGSALVLGRTVTRQSRRLQRLAADLGDGTPVTAAQGDRDRSELAAVEAELALTSRRLHEAREKVDALEESRRELVAWISHDLRTPLAGLRAMAEALEDGMASDPQRFHRQMRSQIDHLSDLVDDLFELSKIQSGRLVLTMETVSLYDLVSDAVSELRSVADARGIVIRESPRPDLMVHGDARELSRVVGNLLVNAIQHSPAGSQISVTTESDADGNAVLSVVDAGGGIPESDLPQIFRAGWRATVSRTPEQLWGRSSGAGLGLAIVHGIVEAHDGDVVARNVDGGCRFDVVLPRLAVA